MSVPRTLFRGIGFFCFFLVFFCFPRVFLVFGSGSFYRLLGPPKTKKPRGKPKKQKKPKKTKGFSGMSGPRILFRSIVFFFLGFFFRFFWFSSSFFDFSLRKLLSATRTTNNPRTSRKTKKNRKNTVFSGMSGPLSSDAVMFYVFFFVLWFSCFWFLVVVAAPPPQKINLFSFKPYHPLICLHLFFALFNASCSCSQKINKSRS